MLDQDHQELTPVDQIADQTLFATQEPVLEPIEDGRAKVNVWQKFRSWPLIIQLVLGLMLLLVVMIGLIASWRFLQPAPYLPVRPVPTASPVYPSTVLNQYEQELATVESTVSEADPARDNLPFPPVDLELLLD